MPEITALNTPPSKVVWASVDEGVREQVRGWIQQLLEEEVTELIGRSRYSRRETGERETGEPEPPTPRGDQPVYRNGYGKERQLTLGCGTVTLRRPRVRGLAERFESRILPLFQRRSPGVNALLPQLYLHGLAEGDFDLALRGLLGENAPVSASTVARLKESWQGEYDQWQQRSLAELEVVYLWADGIYVKAGLEKEKAALLVVVGALRDGRKVILAVQAGHRESVESWSALLRDLKQRGLNSPQLVIADGHLGLWGALANIYPAAREQRCWNHRMVNVLDRLPQKLQGPAREFLRAMMYAASRADAQSRKALFQAWCRKRGQAAAGELLDHDWERLVAYYDFPAEHWKHLRTTNPVESPFAAVRLRTSAAKRYKKVANATAVLWKTLLLAEQSFRKLNAFELLAEVAAGVEYVDGERVRHYLKVAA